MRKAVVILGSQKTLPVSMAVLAYLPEELGEKGTIAVPCILGHLSQLLIDSYVATKWSEIEEIKEADSNKGVPEASIASTDIPDATSEEVADLEAPVGRVNL
jgi:sodium/bile acid cotransporter 7